MIHIDFLIEDISGKIMLEHLLPKVIQQDNVTYRLHSYKGIGRIPGNLKSAKTIRNRQLLEQLPRLLSGFGRTYQSWGSIMSGYTVVVCDLDDRNIRNFKTQLTNVLSFCTVQPETRFCFAIEEGEAWFLGDIQAIKKVYPKVNMHVMHSYTQDSICGTWEVLANAIGFSRRDATYQDVGLEKRIWAEKITPHLIIEDNKSSSFHFFCDTIRKILETEMKKI